VELIDRYLAALAARDPDAVPFAPDVRIVENLKPIRPGEGLWASATGGPTSFSVCVPDAGGQAAGFIGVIESDGAPVLLGLRLKLDGGGRVNEAEHLVAAGLAERNLANLRNPRPGLLEQIPVAKRLPAQQLRAIAATYYDALEKNASELCPFAADCERHENGLVTAGPAKGAPPPGSTFPPTPDDAAGQIDSGVFTYIARIEHRRVFAADPATGLAMGLSHFRHPMDNVPYEVRLADGTATMFTPSFAPFDLPAAHIFKVGPDERVHEIEAMGFLAPYNSPVGW